MFDERVRFSVRPPFIRDQSTSPSIWSIENDRPSPSLWSTPMRNPFRGEAFGHAGRSFSRGRPASRADQMPLAFDGRQQQRL